MKEMFVLMRRNTCCGVFSSEKACEAALKRMHSCEALARDTSFDDFAADFTLSVFPVDYVSYGSLVG